MSNEKELPLDTARKYMVPGRLLYEGASLYDMHDKQYTVSNISIEDNTVTLTYTESGQVERPTIGDCFRYHDEVVAFYSANMSEDSGDL